MRKPTQPWPAARACFGTGLGGARAPKLIRHDVLGMMRPASVYAFPPPAVTELGHATGFDLMLQDRGGIGHEKLRQAREQLPGLAAADPRLIAVRANGMPDVPECKLDVDWEGAGTLGVPVSAAHSCVSAPFGSAYVSDLIRSGRVKRVYVQADAPYRMLPTDLDRLRVRNNTGGLVPLSAIATGRWV